jgi:8-oxo-dGTP pyrophosphatase MutT (NUDIX family)
MRCVIHGSFRKHLPEIREVIRVFSSAGIEVLAPTSTDVSSIQDGFLKFAGEEERDPRLIELLYLQKLKHLGRDGFSFFVNPGGYLGRSASYELGLAQAMNVPCFFLERPSDHPVYHPQNAIWQPTDLAAYIQEQGTIPAPFVGANEEKIFQLWKELVVPGSVVAAGGMIEYAGDRSEKELLFVKTHKWGGRYSMVGGKVRRQETLIEALRREVYEETGLQAKPTKHLCTFDQVRNSGYYDPGVQHIFVDYVVEVDSKKVTLNEEAQSYVWLPAREALASLEIEPNAKHTLELYLDAQRVTAG